LKDATRSITGSTARSGARMADEVRGLADACTPAGRHACHPASPSTSCASRRRSSSSAWLPIGVVAVVDLNGAESMASAAADARDGGHSRTRPARLQKSASADARSGEVSS
jgi:hypothetical protein